MTPKSVPQQIIKFNTNGMFPAVYIDLNQVSCICTVEIASMMGVENRISVRFKSGGETLLLNHTFASDLTRYMDAWMEHINSQVE